MGVALVEVVAGDGTGNASFFGKQVAAALLVSAYSFGVTWLILKVLNRFEPVRVPDETETAGLDTDFEEQAIYPS